MATQTTYTDGGFATGTGSDVTIDGYAYTLDTVSHELPISQADAMYGTGLPKGGAFVLGKQKHTVKINAVTGTPRPSQLKPFAWTPPAESVSSWWIVGGIKVNSSNSGASIRTYDADVIQLINTPT